LPGATFTLAAIQDHVDMRVIGERPAKILEQWQPSAGHNKEAVIRPTICERSSTGQVLRGP
jgi:hypothetical protein